MADKLFRTYYNEKTELSAALDAGKILVQSGTDEPKKVDANLFASQLDLNSKENTSNKQNSLAVDGTGLKYPTVDAVNDGTATAAQGVLADSSVQLTGETSQSIEGDLEISKLDRANGASLAIINSFEGSGWVNGDVIGAFDFKINDTSATQKVRGQIKVLNVGAGSSTYPFSNVMVFSTALNNNLIEALRLNSNQSATFASSVSATDGLFSGKVNIGSTNSTGKLNVSGVNEGDVYFMGANSNARALQFSTFVTASPFAGHRINATSSNGKIALAISGTDALTINSDRSATFAASVTATSFIGSGSQLTGVASEAQGVLADTALQPFIDNTNVIFRSDGSNTFNISRNGNIGGSSPFLDMLCDTSSTRLRATGGLSFWNRVLNGTLSESARFTENGNFAVGQLIATEKIDVNGNVKANSFLAPLVTIVEETTLTVSNSEVIIDAASQAVSAILPTVASVPVGKKYTVIAYDATNTITLATSSSQQIRQVKTDTTTSTTLAAGDIYTVINTGTYWQIISKQ